tara:strand:+ start:2236 stop:2700 length:465 start_codon:yes stop_codon:yes gene_type:complete
MPKGGLSYKSYTACVRDAAANGVSAKSCSALASGSGMPNSSGNNMPQPRPGSIKGYGGGNTITPQPDPRRPQGNQAMSGQGGNMVRKPGQNLPVQPGRPGRRPGQNQVMSGQGPASMRPGNVTGPAPGRPRPLRKRGRGPAPIPPGPNMRRRTY